MVFCSYCLDFLIWLFHPIKNYFTVLSTTAPQEKITSMKTTSRKMSHNFQEMISRSNIDLHGYWKESSINKFFVRIWSAWILHVFLILVFFVCVAVCYCFAAMIFQLKKDVSLTFLLFPSATLILLSLFTPPLLSNYCCLNSLLLLVGRERDVYFNCLIYGPDMMVNKSSSPMCMFS